MNKVNTPSLSIVWALYSILGHLNVGYECLFGKYWCVQNRPILESDESGKNRTILVTHATA